ncbi:unnamed protein product [Effrenium voratum]|uniref:Uncharacterized protein n=1 Tax=Effrenium voratum TaxID=2562239 RepID=A0AA36HVR5_9DINO|nr:unnamed protein product [Effrenium voratum]
MSAAQAEDAENSQVQLLKELLLQQTRRSEQLGQQAAARDWERWELLQLLRQKDEQLEFEESTAAKQRVVLNSARSSARHYRAVCCLRAWANHVQQLCAERALLRARNRLTVGRARHAGSLLRSVLKHLVERQLGFALHRLWLRRAAPDVRPLPDPVFSTPVKHAEGRLRGRPPPSWDPSPRPLPRMPGSDRRLNASMSEISTEIPSVLLESGQRSSASSVCAAEASAPRMQCAGAAQLAISLQRSVARRLFWSFARWTRGQEVLDSLLSPRSQRELQGLELQGFERRCEVLERRCAEQAGWRGEAERRIKQLAASGERVERDRRARPSELTDAQHEERARAEQAEALRDTLEQEEQLGELLRARLWALEQDNELMTKEVEAEKMLSMEGEEQFHQQLAAFNMERSELVASIHSAKAAQEASAQQVADKVRRSLLEAWGRDRGKWAQERADLSATAAKASEEAKFAQVAAINAEAEAAAKVRWAAGEAKEVAKAELRGEEHLCTQLAAELRERISQAPGPRLRGGGREDHRQWEGLAGDWGGGGRAV